MSTLFRPRRPREVQASAPAPSRFVVPIPVLTQAALLAVALPFFAGCGDRSASSDPAPASKSSAAAAAAPATTAVRPMGDADLLAGIPVGAAVTNKELAAAEQAWMNLLTAMRPPQPPEEWQTNRPSKEAQAEFRRKVGESAAKTATLAQDFYAKYPQHENAAEARERELHLLNAAIQLGYTNAQARLTTLEENRLKDPNLPEDERLQLRMQQVQRTAFKLGGEDTKAVLAELEKGARAIQKEFPKRPETAGLLMAVAEGWLERGDATRARTLATEVSTTAVDEDAKDAAGALLRKLDRLGKSLDLKFSAIDGRAVDVQSMKGKVVLVDFWATWCGPCLEELPNVKAAYQKLQAKGFEIVGISLDRKKDDLTKMIADEKIPWPQFFDDSGEGNRFAQQFEVESIPTMWLVDKKGLLRDLNAREDLAGKVEKLLAE